MKLLLIEDDKSFIEALRPALTKIVDPNDLTIAHSRDSALAILSASKFDLIVVDQMIPPEDGSVDVHLDHGRLVFTHIRRATPGTPVWFFSAFGLADFMAALLNLHQQGDLWGSGTLEHLALSFTKKETIEFIEG
jgi:CheY-like chemotaxis protein